jgi:uncharacterized protein (TIGR02996 family)
MPRPKRASGSRSASGTYNPRPQVLAFLRDIKEHPEDDTPRLILADWLEEHGDEADVARAEFIRLQCRAARLPADAPEAKSLQKQASELRGKHGAAWLGPVKDVCDGSPVFSRGLVHIAVRGRTFASKRGLALAQTEAYAWVDSLRFCSVAPSALAVLAATPLLGGLNALSFRDCPLRAAGAKALAGSPYLECLTRLDLHHCWIENGGVAALTAAARSSKLREIDLHHNFLWSDGVANLARWTGMANVERLDLSVNVFDVRGVRALAESPNLTRLTYLNLQNCFIEDAGTAALANAPFLDHLTELNLIYNKLGDAGARALAESPYLSRIQRLRISHDHRLSQAGWAVLRERFGRVLNG